jgi:hypothetical protein
MSFIDPVAKPQDPVFPAKAGTQIQPEHPGCSRPSTVSAGVAPMGSIWAPAFAGEAGKGNANG